MDAKVREELLKAEYKFRQAVREEVILSKAYDIGLQYNLSMDHMVLLAFPYLMDEIKRLRIMAGDWSSEKDFESKYLSEWPIEPQPLDPGYNQLQESENNYKIITGGRGGGKTEALSEDMKKRGYK